MSAQFITGLLVGGILGAVLTVFILALCNTTRQPAMPAMPAVEGPLFPVGSKWSAEGARGRQDYEQGRVVPFPAGSGRPPLRAGEHLRAFSDIEIRGDLAYEVPPHDVWPSRLANLVCWSGVFAEKQPWLGTAAELRIALVAPTSRLNWRNQRELPPAAAIEARLQGMLHSHGRITVERVGYNAAGQTMWSLNLAQEETAPC